MMLKRFLKPFFDDIGIELWSDISYEKPLYRGEVWDCPICLYNWKIDYKYDITIKSNKLFIWIKPPKGEKITEEEYEEIEFFNKKVFDK